MGLRRASPVGAMTDGTIYCPLCRRPVQPKEGRMWRFECVTSWCGVSFRFGDAGQAARAMLRREAHDRAEAAAPVVLTDEEYLYG